MKSSTKEIKISEILHLAADKYLSSAKNRSMYLLDWKHTQWYSCWAIEEAIYELMPLYDDIFEAVSDCIMIGLKAIGCNTDSSSLFEDSEYPQGDRYMWLKFAAIIAEEQEAAGYKLFV